jgi:hypothetical protein
VEYVSIVIALLATGIGVFGDTRRRNAHGWRRLTGLGYAALALAVLACAVSIFKTHSAITKQHERRVEANDLLVISTDEIMRNVYWSRVEETTEGLSQASKELQENLSRVGTRIGRTVQLYQDVMDTPTQKAALAIQIMTTEEANEVENKGMARGYLRGLDKEIHNLRRAIGFPLSDNDGSYPELQRFAFDFEHPDPDPSIH